MKNYQEMLAAYRKRQRNTVVDAIATGLTFMDEIAVESGLLEETGLLAELTESVCGALPCAIIAVQEGSKVVLGLKPAANGVQDSAFRMAKTGAALGVGGYPRGRVIEIYGPESSGKTTIALQIVSSAKAAYSGCRMRYICSRFPA